MMKKIMCLLVLACVFAIAGLPLTASATTVGGDQGWYKVHCNVDGAQVYFDSELKGQISGGQLSVAIYTTGTPYQEYSVQNAGYYPFSAKITQYPGKGETVALYATLNPEAAPTKSPLSPVTGIVAISVIGLASAMLFRKEN